MLEHVGRSGYKLPADYWFSVDCTPFWQPTTTITYVPNTKNKVVDTTVKGLIIDAFA